MDSSAYKAIFAQVKEKTGNRYAVSKLLLNLGSAYEAHMLHAARKLNLAFGEYSILVHLYFSESRNARNSQNDLARQQKRDKALIARATRKLLKIGYISSQRDPENRTRNIITLAPKGREIIPQLLEALEAWEREVVYPLGNEVGGFLESLIGAHTRAEAFYDKEVGIKKG